MMEPSRNRRTGRRRQTNNELTEFNPPPKPAELVVDTQDPMDRVFVYQPPTETKTEDQPTEKSE